MASVTSAVDIDDFEFVISDNLQVEDIENDWCLLNLENRGSTVDESKEENVLQTPSAVEYDFMTWSEDSESEELGESNGKGEISREVEYDWLIWSEDSESEELGESNGKEGEISSEVEYDWLIWSDDSDSELVEDTAFESIEIESVKDLTDAKELPVWQTEEAGCTHNQLEETDFHGFENIDYQFFSNSELSAQQEFWHDFEVEEEFFPESDFYVSCDDMISEDSIGDSNFYDDQEYILDVYVTEGGRMSRKRDHLGNRARKKYSKKDNSLKKYSWKSTTYDPY